MGLLRPHDRDTSMNQFAFFAVTLLLFSAFDTRVVYADDAAKVDHYEAKTFTNAKEAMSDLISTSIEMAHIAAHDDLNSAQIEDIHQISYTTENAVMYLETDEKLAAALEELHLASERHDAADLKNKVIMYQAELTAYLAKN